MRLILAIDGGGTRTRCIAIDRDGRVVSEAEAGPSNHLQVPVDEATEALRAVTLAAMSRAGATPADVTLVSAGLAGVDYDGSGGDVAAEMVRSVGFDRALVNGDMVIAHRGALAGEPGVVALAGTGSSVLGIATGGSLFKAGGWGPLYGNQGSAYQLGRLGLVAAAEAFDGSGPPTALVSRLASALDVVDFRGTVRRVYADLSGQEHVAALAPVVDACAEEGDEIASAICRRAGGDLARAVLAVVRRMGESQTSVSYQGTVLSRSRKVREAFLGMIETGAAGVEVRPPRFEPIAGAALLGSEAVGWRVSLESLEIPRGV